MAREKNERDGNSRTGARKSMNIALFGVVGVFVVLLIGAVIVMASLLYQFTNGKNALGGDVLSDYSEGMLVIRETPSSDGDSPEQEGGLSAGDVSRSVLLSSVTVKTYLLDSDLEADESAFGVVMNEDGYILTSASVVKENSIIEAVLYDGRSFRAKLVGYDLKTDIGVIKIEAENLRTAPFGSGDIKDGERFLYVGLGQRGLYSISEGTSAARAGIFFDTPAGFSFQQVTSTDRWGSSLHMGGVAVNSYGQIVGTRCSYIEDEYRLVYAIPVSETKDVIDSIIRSGYVEGRKTLGYTGSAVSDVLAETMGIPRGVVIGAIEEGSGLKSVDVEIGDIITAVNNVQISSVEELEKTVSQSISGSVSLRIHRPSEKRSHEEHQVLLTDDPGTYG